MSEKLEFILGIFMEKAAHDMEKTTETLVSLALSVMDKLAGKESDLKLNFDDLTLEVGMVKAKLNGSIVLSVVYSKDAKEPISSE